MKQVISHSEENYLKSIYNLSVHIDKNQVSTNLIANLLETKASSVSEMVKKLADKNLVKYQKYKGCELTSKGHKIAAQIIRKHRLWETFLVEKLHFKWGEVHEIAEQLEHIDSSLLTERLSEMLNHPKFDPHGDPIPDVNGVFPKHDSVICLKDVLINQKGNIVKIGSNNKDLLNFLSKNDLNIDAKIKCIDKNDFDGSMEIEINKGIRLMLSKKVIKNIFLKLNRK